MFPQPWEASLLFGREAEERLLRRALAHEACHPAWLLVGARGVGKTALAYALARFALHGGGLHGGASSSAIGSGDRLTIPADAVDARLIARRSHPRLSAPGSEPERAVQTGAPRRGGVSVDEIRPVAPFMMRTTGAREWRVCIVDDADAMTRAAADALLKIIEEPPSRRLFILTARRAGAIPATLRSRCRLLRLRPLEATAMRRLLESTDPDGDPDGDPDDREAILHIAEGLPGRAAAFRAQGGFALQSRLHAEFDAMPDNDIVALHRLCADLAADPAREAAARDMVTARLRVAMRASAGLSATADSEADGGARSSPRGACPTTPTARDWAEAFAAMETLFAQADELFLDRRQTWLRVFMTLGAVLGGLKGARRAPPPM